MITVDIKGGETFQVPYTAGMNAQGAFRGYRQ